MPRKSWWARLPFGVRMTAGACAMFVIVGGGVAGAVSTMTAPGPSEVAAQPVDPDLGAPRLEEDPEVVSRAAAAAEPLPLRRGETTAPARPAAPAPAATADDESTEAPAARHKAPAPRVPAGPRQAGVPAGPDQARVPTAADRLSQARVADDRADRTGPRRVRTLAEAPARRLAAAAPVVTTRTDVETRSVPFDTRVVRDPSMPRGARRVTTRGASGERTLRYLVTLTDGRPSSRRLLSSAVTREPQHRVVTVGSARPVEPDVDCEQILGICLPFGRSAPACLVDGREGPEPVGVGDGSAGEDLDLLIAGGPDPAGLEPATLC
ncbi:G5 domain-containing protein [Actinoplanes philippinensis]|uniref:G5 domain-containing protein n=1 Tax=Actinoplanes philippinensis TaxID=35752 RepID=UPI0034064DBC